MAMFSHGVLIYRLKNMENTRMTFYRQFPISLFQRFLQYAFFYLMIFIPEIITISVRTPANLTYPEAATFVVLGYGILLLLNSLQLYNYSGVREYFKIIMQIFIVFTLSLISRTYLEFSILIFILAVVLFFMRYYRFEPLPDNTMT
jgi:hypothetical protein